MSNHHLIIFVKNPVKGKVKTRIAKTTGEQKALEIYLNLLSLLKGSLLDIEINKHVFYSDFIDEFDIWDNDRFYKHVQNGKDLGDRMKNAFKVIFESVGNSASKAIIIGSDCPTLNQRIIDESLNGLEQNDFVLGPTFDGGYYLLGMKYMADSVFENISWSTADVFIQTKRRIDSENLSCYELPYLNDIDTEQDWLHFLQDNQ